MLFSSLTFLYLFLPITIILYFVSPKQMKNYTLLLASLVFYGWGEPKYIFLMLVSVLINYLFALFIEWTYAKSTQTPKILLCVDVIVNLAFLGFFKYSNFFIENFNAITGLNISLLKVTLPIGISFYTFQILGYVIDVYRQQIPAQKNPFLLATYISLFPQLIAGPIVRYADVYKQLEHRELNHSQIYACICRFVIGLSKKIIIANSLGELCEVFKISQDKSVAYFWLYGIAFMLHIYFDFSGYSDMAIGIGKIFGFDFLENFNYPYISSSITEFWRRWHMSLGTFFRDYVYIPLGGNRVSKSRHYFNIFIVWILTGFWHGAAWNFIFWGLFYAVLLMIEKAWLLKYLQKHKVFGHIYTLVAVLIGFVLFNASSLSEAVHYIFGGLFGFMNYPVFSTEFFFELKNYGVILGLGILFSTPILSVMKKEWKNDRIEKLWRGFQPIGLIFMLLICTAYLVDGSFNPFLYFRF